MQAKSILPCTATATATADLPPQTIGDEERRDLETEAGHPFVSDAAAHAYRLRNIHSQAVDAMLAEAVRP